MTLGDELRAVLNHEADVQVTARPEVNRLIVGGRARRRRRTMNRVSGAALAIVLVGVGAYAVTQDSGEPRGSRIAINPTVTPEPDAAGPLALPDDPGTGYVRPGTFRVMVGTDQTGGVIWADLTFEDTGWRAGNFPIKSLDAYYGGVGVYEPHTLAAGSGCSSDVTDPDLATSPQALARQLTRLPESKVVQPVTASEVLGRDAFHVRVKFLDVLACPEWYQVAESVRGSRGISYHAPSHTVLMDFWVMDLDGTVVVVDSWHQTGASAELVEQVARARDAITIVPRT